MENVLSSILETKKKKIKVLKKNKDAFISLLKDTAQPLSFKKAIKREGKISLIAEIKHSSPSGGILRKDFYPVEIAKLYEISKVNAISVVTEEEFFGGKINYIEEIKKEVNLPVLRKDFITDEIEILESRAAGADAILLIMRILSQERFRKLYHLSRDLGMDVLVEMHTEKELHRVIKEGVEIVGINNRDLDTLEIDFTLTQKLIPFIPPDIVKVSESGMRTLKDILLLKGLNVDAMLVGEAFMRAENIEEKIKELHIDA